MNSFRLALVRSTRSLVTDRIGASIDCFLGLRRHSTQASSVQIASGSIERINNADALLGDLGRRLGGYTDEEHRDMAKQVRAAREQLHLLQVRTTTEAHIHQAQAKALDRLDELKTDVGYVYFFALLSFFMQVIGFAART